MVVFALFIALYSYSIFALGILDLLYDKAIYLVTLTFFIAIMFFYRKQATDVLGYTHRLYTAFLKLKFFDRLVILLILLQILVNLIGALGPELAFDSLWYHLTIPKIWLLNHEIFHIPGGLYYYSDMPKFVEMLYTPGILIGGDILPKIIHFAFGIGCLIVIFKLSKKFVSKRLALICVLAFYSNLVVDWLSITAYIDLGRTFFEISAMYYLFEYFELKKTNLLIISSMMLGLAIASKVLALASLVVFLPIIFFSTRSILKTLFFCIISLLIPAPWLIFAYLNTGNAFYPFFSNVYPISQSISVVNIINFVHNQDPISPIYLIGLPIVLLTFKKFNYQEKMIGIFSLISFIVWFSAPQTGGGRFITAYLPAFSLLIIIAYKHLKDSNIKNVFILIVILISLVSISYRFFANIKYLPVIFGRESKSEFLKNNLNFDFGDFYDTDGYFAKNIKASDRVLILGIHNLYYVDFPFIEGSYLNANDKYNYILVRGQFNPVYSKWSLIYKNNTTHVKLYKKK